MRVGDVLVAINGQNVQQLNLEEVLVLLGVPVVVISE